MLRFIRHTAFLTIICLFAGIGTLALQAQSRLVPVKLSVDGNFRIAPPYVTDPAFVEKPNVPKGRVIRFLMNSADSKIFPTAPVGGAGRGQPAPAGPPTHQTFDRQIAVYVPAGYVPNTPAPFIVVQDERSFIKEDAGTGRDGQPITNLAFIPVM